MITIITQSDNCDHNFGTFDDFGVKNDQTVSHNMIKKGTVTWWKRGPTKFGHPPLPFRAMLERNFFFAGGVP